MTRRLKGLLILLVLSAGLSAFIRYGRALWVPVYYSVVGRRTVEDVLEKTGFAAYNRLEPYIEKAGACYPPAGLTLIALKDRKKLELWFEQKDSPVFIRSYDILGASGRSGPKLQEGDFQVPEGIYRVTGLNPVSSYHLSMKLDYPNKFDREKARLDGRSDLGGDIFIHGSNASAGCLAMGDDAIEELFMLAADAGIANVKVIIAPVDMRSHAASVPADAPAWLPELYKTIKREIRRYDR